MSMWVMIRHKVKPDEVERELEQLAAVFEELESSGLEGARYATFQLADQVSFVALVETDDPSQFGQIEAFRTYRSGLDQRCDEPPVVIPLTTVGAYRFP